MTRLTDTLERAGVLRVGIFARRGGDHPRSQMSQTSTRTPDRLLRGRDMLLLTLLLGGLFPGRAGAQAYGSVDITATVVARVSTTLSHTGGAMVRAVAGGVVLTQHMALSSNVDSQTLEAALTTGTDDTPVTVSVRCGGGAGRCRLSGGDTPRIAIEVIVAGLSQGQVQEALAAPDRFAARVTYRLVRGEGT